MTWKITFLILLASLAPGCDELAPSEASSVPMNKRPTGSYTGHLIAKPFVNKAGKVAGPEELYLRLGMGDFFIKFPESDVSAADLKPKLNQAITVEGEIRNGAWDIGPGDPPEEQSRTGDYFVITKLL